MKPNDIQQHVFIIGCKGIPASYGGYETFVDKLTKYQKSEKIQYHVACAVDDISKEPEEFNHNGAKCFNIQWKKMGSARAVFYDIDAIKWSIRYIKKYNIQHPIIYVLACRIGPFIGYLKSQIKRLNGEIFINPDGHEWMRAKWSAPIRKYWKISERLMVKQADLIICDSKNIEKYILDEYKKYVPKTTFIAYGAETSKSLLMNNDTVLTEWYSRKGVEPFSYYLVVGRFIPENNFEIMIKEFMISKTKKDFVIITNVSEKFLQELEVKTKFSTDSRIKFVGTVYDQEILKKIRENAYGYLHGHEVGGTNPSLLEALSSTKLNLLLDVGFNREVAELGAIYWSKQVGDLAKLIDRVDLFTNEVIDELNILAKKRILENYNWEFIEGEYERVFLK